MLILALDTSTSRLSLALRDGDRILAHRESWPERRQAEVVLPELQVLLHDAGLTPGDVQGFAVGLGPGSFTGLRVGVAVIQGLAQSLNRPAAGVSSFLTLATAGDAERVLAVSDARQEMVYAGLYRRAGAEVVAEWPESLLTLPALAAQLPAGPILLTGPAAEACAAAMPQLSFQMAAPELRFPFAAEVARLAAPALAAGGQPPETLTPNYLRRTQAETQREKR